MIHKGGSFMEKTAGIVLAAGRSERLGRPKQLVTLGHKPIIRHVCERAVASELDRLIVVVGHRADDVTEAIGNDLCDGERLRTVYNPHFRSGMGRSLQTGLSQVWEWYSSIMILLGDQPLVTSTLINHLLRRFYSSGKDICVPVHKGQRRNPVILGRRFYNDIMRIDGDKGARDIIQDNDDAVEAIEISNERYFMDVDTREDYEMLRALYERTFQDCS